MSQRLALVVDDSRSARFALRKHLESHAFKVDTAESARAAYAWLKEQTPDMIFLDHVMPDEDGLAALRHLKADPHTASIPVVICSSNEGEAFVAQAREEGAADVLQKPPSPEQLQRVLDQLESAMALTSGEPAPRAAPSALELDLDLEPEPGPTSPAAADAHPAAVQMPAAPAVVERAAHPPTPARPAPAPETAPSGPGFDAVVSAIRSRMSAIEARLSADLDALREQVESLTGRQAEQLEAMRAKFDADLRAAEQRHAAELAEAVRAARSQAAAEIRETLLAALRE